MRKKIIIWIPAAAIFLFGVYFSEKVLGCKKNGFAREDAIVIAREKLEIDFVKLNFLLKDEKLENYDKAWIFTFNRGECLVDVVVDRCGVSDIGGLTEECFPFQKK